MNELPQVTINNEPYIVDARLREWRPVARPHEPISFGTDGLVLKKTTCPECNELIRGTVENLPATALMWREDGVWHHTDQTECWWDGQESRYRESKGKLYIQVDCNFGHRWWTRVYRPKEGGL